MDLSKAEKTYNIVLISFIKNTEDLKLVYISVIIIFFRTF